MQRGLNPLAYVLSGFDWHGKTGRVGFLVALAMFLASVAGQSVSGSVWALPEWARSVLIIFSALWLVPFLGHVMRRLNAIGWSGWLCWLLVVPYVWMLFALVLAAKRSGPRSRPVQSGVGRDLGFWLVCSVAVIVLTRLFWTPYFIPSGSMKPTLLVGDYVVASRSLAAPALGQIVVLRHPVTGILVIGRVLGLPGDRVQMQDGVVLFNGTPLTQTPAGLFVETMAPQGPMGLLPRCSNGAVGQGAACQKHMLTEALNGRSWGIVDIGQSAQDTTAEFTVPEGMVFVLGDNRDNAADSRFAQSAGGLGFVPFENLQGHIWFVGVSAAGSAWWQFWTWRQDRIFVAVP